MDYNKLAEKFIQQVKDSNKSQVINNFNSFGHGEHQVIFYLYKNSGKAIVPSDISKYTNTSTARIATILNNLEEKGMITREISREDRRKILVSITDKGRRYAEESRAKHVGYLAEVLEEMGEERSQSFIENMTLFLEIGKRKQEEENKKDA